MSEATESTILPIPAAPAQVPVRDFRAGTAALAEMPQGEFDLRLASMRRGRERVKQIHRELMDVENDYGVIQGTQKPTLLKPGAEKLCEFYRLAAEFRPKIEYSDELHLPPITIVTECLLHLGSLDGPVVNTGHGAANSWEKRYRYRRGERACPTCGMIGAIIKGKAEYGGGWLCFGKKGGCGAKFNEQAPEIVNQPVGDVENTEPFDMLNTVLKMSEKRAYVDATLRATATSGLYTQDMEELAPVEMAPTIEGKYQKPRPKDEVPMPEPEFCQFKDCDLELTGDEIKGSQKNFGDERYCTPHGREMKALKRVEEAEAAEKADPFVAAD